MKISYAWIKSFKYLKSSVIVVIQIRIQAKFDSEFELQVE